MTTTPSNQGAAGTEVPLGPAAGPGFESLPDGEAETAPVGPGDWYDVNRSGDAAGDIAGGDGLASDGFAGDGLAAIEAWDSTQSRMLLGISIMLLIASILGLVIWRRKRREAMQQSVPNTALASGIRNSIAHQMPATLGDMPDADFNDWVAPSQIADLAAFLLSDASSAISGENVRIRGGV